MKRTPVLTLLAGLALGGVLLALSAHAASRPSRQAGPPPATAAAAPSAAVSPTAATTSPPLVNAIWAGEVDGGAASIAISVHDGVAIAYLCDGKREAWLQGTAANGKLTLTGKDGSSLTGTFGGGKATGTVIAAGKQWTFTAPTAAPPSGLYRAAQIVDSAKVVCGWIVLANGKQVGACSTEGKETTAAPPLNTATAYPVDPKDVS
jgi:hypothetical protein